MTGTTADISHICKFKWYNWIYFHDSNKDVVRYPTSKEILGRYLGPTKPSHGSTMSYWVLKGNGETVHYNTL